MSETSRLLLDLVKGKMEIVRLVTLHGFVLCLRKSGRNKLIASLLTLYYRSEIVKKKKKNHHQHQSLGQFFTKDV